MMLQDDLLNSKTQRQKGILRSATEHVHVERNVLPSFTLERCPRARIFHDVKEPHQSFETNFTFHIC